MTPDPADHISLVKKIAFLFGLPHLAQDLISVGFIGLMHACANYDPTKGAQFKTYASIRIKGAMADFLRAERGIGRRRGRRSEEIEIISLDVYEDGGNMHEEIGTDGQINKLRFWKNVKHELNARHWEVIYLHFKQQKTLKETGKEMGISEGRACQLKGEALAVLYSKGDVLIKESMPLVPILTEGNML